MKLISYSTETPTRFDNEQARGVAGRVVIGKNDGAERFCMRVFEIAPGGHSPRHTHDWEHEIFVHRGTGEVYGNGQWRPIGEGCVIFVPPGEDHQIRNTGGDLLIFVCLVPAGAPEL